MVMSELSTLDYIQLGIIIILILLFVAYLLFYLHALIDERERNLLKKSPEHNLYRVDTISTISSTVSNDFYLDLQLPTYEEALTLQTAQYLTLEKSN